MAESAHGRRRVDGTRAEAVVYGGFGTLWWIAGSGPLGAPGGTALLVTGAVVGAALIATAVLGLNSIGEQERMHRARRVYRYVNLAQAAGIAGTIAGATVLDARQWIPGLIAVVVGAHFAPLARAFEARGMLVTGALCATAGAAGCALARSGATLDTTLPATALPVAAVLWGMAVALLTARMRTPQA